MKIKSIAMVKNQAEAQKIAISWQKWQDKINMSWGEVAKWGEYFKTLAEKFNLEVEFKENGII